MTIAVAKPAGKTWLEGLGDGIKNFWSHDMAPFLLRLWGFIQMDVLKQLVPIAEAEAAKLDAALFSGGTEGFLKAFNATIPGVLQQAEAAGIGATIHDVITATQGVLAPKMQN